jgi:hypothetical protein
MTGDTLPDKYIKQGWHYCRDYGYRLIGPGSWQYNQLCHCGVKDMLEEEE